jgi:outer membrane lipoprotein SlyB
MNRISTIVLMASFSTTLLCACSAHPDPIIDSKGVNMTVYAEDLAECKGYAEQIDPGTGMAKGAAAGAATGAAIGAIRSGTNVGESAGVGAVLGVSKSGVKAADDKENVVKRCLRYRGYKVLN